ncbi:3-dehydroquinate synthase [Candidatus Pacearchaeota archaeon]|nr:3-dehydroquinate synthase [Candidatus Pacearchaeota archaeon]
MVNILLQSKKYSQTKVIGKNFSYDLYIGEVLSELENFIKNSNYRAIRILTDPNLVEAGHLKTLLNLLKNSGKKVSYGIIKAGEQFKHIKYFSEMIAAVDEPELDRKTLLIALGGGVIGDEVGYIASSYLRGVDLLQMPTTPLSAADSSIGMKVGIDTDKGKNRVGAFKAPVAVFIETSFFDSFKNSPNKHYGYDSSWAETIKHSCSYDALHKQLNSKEKFVDLVERSISGIKEFEKKTINPLMLRNIIAKGEVVETDPEESGARVGLNLGHTFGHAFETFMNRILIKKDPSGATVYPHGDAVGVGCHFAAWLAVLKKTGLTEADLKRQLKLYENLGIETRIPEEAKNSFEEIYKIMAADKKAVSGKPLFVLQERLGKLKKISERQPDGSEALGGYYLQPIEKEFLLKAFEKIK